MTHLHRLPRFVAVGGVAAAVHFGVVLLLVSRSAAPPLVANVLAWVPAFAVSFLGQWRLTFAAQLAPASRALPRFVTVSLCAFALNEIAYAALLHWTTLSYRVLLAIVLAGVAFLTYVASLRWAFVPRGA